jgi:malic enzyme
MGFQEKRLVSDAVSKVTPSNRTPDIAPLRVPSPQPPNVVPLEYQRVTDFVFTDAQLSPSFVVPSVFDKSIVERVAPAVAAAAIADGIIRKS